MDASKFTTRSQEAINTAISTAASGGHAQVEAVHLLAALLAQPEGIARPLFEAAGVQPAAVIAGVEAELKKLPAASGSTVAAPSYSRAALQILATAQRHRRRDEGRLRLHRAPADRRGRRSTAPPARC